MVINVGTEVLSLGEWSAGDNVVVQIEDGCAS